MRASTGFDSAEPCCRSQIVRITIAASDRNSLCQFWSDSCQNLAVPMYCTVDTGDSPCATCSAECSRAAGGVHQEADDEEGHERDAERVGVEPSPRPAAAGPAKGRRHEEDRSRSTSSSSSGSFDSADPFCRSQTVRRTNIPICRNSLSQFSPVASMKCPVQVLASTPLAPRCAATARRCTRACRSSFGRTRCRRTGPAARLTARSRAQTPQTRFRFCRRTSGALPVDRA